MLRNHDKFFGTRIEFLSHPECLLSHEGGCPGWLMQGLVEAAPIILSLTLQSGPLGGLFVLWGFY